MYLVWIVSWIDASNDIAHRMVGPREKMQIIEHAQIYSWALKKSTI